MKTLTKWMMAAFAAVAVVGCDPFEEAIGGPPAVMTAGFSDGAFGTAYEGTGSGSTWTVTDIPSSCHSTTGIVDTTGFIYVKYNKLLNGLAIQTSTTDCTPAGALGLNVTYNGGAPPAGKAWYACYNPSSPAPTEGASVVVFMDACSVLDPLTCPTPAPPASGWIDGLLTTSSDQVTVVRATGTAHDKDGAGAAFDVTANFLPNPGTPGAPTFANVTATSVDVSWTAAGCAVAGTTQYLLERAPDNAGAPGTYVTVTTTTALTFSDAGLTTGTLYWYRVTAITSAPGNYPGAHSAARSVPAIPAAPTFTAVTATSVTVNWTAAAAAATYTVQRAPDNAGVPGTWADLQTGLTVLTYTDATVATATRYWYRIVAVNALASANGAAATVLTP